MITNDDYPIEEEVDYNPSLKMDKDLCTDTEYMVCQSMLADGSCNSDPCFPWDKVIGSETYNLLNS